MKVKDVDSALTLFKEAAINHGKATENGDYKTGNKNYDKIVKAITWLKGENKMDHLFQFLTNPDLSVRLWAASYLLPLYEKDALKVIAVISKEKSIIGFSAEMTIKEWKKGN